MLVAVLILLVFVYNQSKSIPYQPQQGSGKVSKDQTRKVSERQPTKNEDYRNTGS